MEEATLNLSMLADGESRLDPRARLDSEHMPHPPSIGTTTRQRARTSNVSLVADSGNDDANNSVVRDVQRQHRESLSGLSPHRKRQRINGDRYAEETITDALTMILTVTLAIGSYRVDLARIYKPVSACYMKTGHQRHRLSRRKEHPMGSFIFKKVSLNTLYSVSAR